MSFGTDHQSLFYMPTIFPKEKIYGICVPQFQLYYIHNTTHSSHNNLVNLFRDVNYMWWGKQGLELREWENSINSKKTRILAIISTKYCM